MNRIKMDSGKTLDEVFAEVREALLREDPMIHCITNPISIHDCANVVLSAGGRPMMAEHPAEVAEITVTAGALALNLGNITDARKASIGIAGKAAMESGITVIMDMVGIGSSHFRKAIIDDFLESKPEETPLILKGNMSELKALAGEGKDISGVDVKPSDMLSGANEKQSTELAVAMAKKYHAVILVSGKTDLVTDGERTFFINNGCEMMGRITGTGCMLNVLTGTYLSVAEPLTAALLACIVSGISGEIAAENSRGSGSFQIAFQDALSLMSQRDIKERSNFREK